MQQLSASKIFEGQQLQYRHRSESLSCDMEFSIYLPPQAESTKVPVVYWLSGLTSTDQNFVIKAGAQRYAAELGVAIVCPDTSPRGEAVPDDSDGAYDFGLGAGFYVNATQSPWDKNYRMYDYVVEELPELVNTSFEVDAGRKGISGHSMGGHGALTVGLKNPDKYLSVTAFAPIVSPINCPWGQKALGSYLGEDQTTWSDYDSCELVKSASNHLPILVDQGEADNFLEEQLKTQLLIEAAERAEYPMQIRYQPGYDHSYFFIASFIADHLEFHSEFF
jgi:S-formylglutathione hydrolase